MSGFEPPASCSQGKRADQTALHPENAGTRSLTTVRMRLSKNLAPTKDFILHFFDRVSKSFSLLLLPTPERQLDDLTALLHVVGDVHGGLDRRD